MKIVLFSSLASLSYQSWLLRQLELQLYQTVLTLLVIPLGHSGTQRRLDVDQGELETKQTAPQISRRSCGRKGKGSGMFAANDKGKKLQADFVVLLAVKTVQIIFIHLDFSINQYSEQCCALCTEIAKMA